MNFPEVIKGPKLFSHIQKANNPKILIFDRLRELCNRIIRLIALRETNSEIKIFPSAVHICLGMYIAQEETVPSTRHATTVT